MPLPASTIIYFSLYSVFKSQLCSSSDRKNKNMVLVYRSLVPIDRWHAFYTYFPVGNYMFKVNYKNTRIRCEICSKLTIKTPERRYWCRFGVFIVNIEYISHLVLLFLLLTLSRYVIPNVRILCIGRLVFPTKLHNKNICISIMMLW